MKTKKLNSKLSLNKETISNLTEVSGGVRFGSPDSGCIECYTDVAQGCTNGMTTSIFRIGCNTVGGFTV